MNEIYIDVGLGESRVAVIDEGDLAEIYIETENDERVAGNIYKGRVENVLPGIQAAFVNIGLEKNAFLYVKDAVRYKSSDIHYKEISISNVLKSGDEILVQVSKEPAGTKGARVTTHITLPGRFLVLMPNIDYIGVSRRIEEERERDRLRDIISQIKPPNMGFIVRTEAEGKNIEDFLEDMNFLIGLWNKINSESQKCGAPRLIHKDADLVYRGIRDLFNRDTDRIVINDKSSYNKALSLIEYFSPEMKDRLEYYEGSINLFDFYGINLKIEKALSRKVWLKSGGYIIIDQTEALTAIDVNTGKFTGSYNLEDTIMHTNMEAAKEIARQLRLRDIGGIIIIDFIDMNSEEHRNKVINTLKNELKKDRTKSNVFGMTQLGLLELTRKKSGKRLSMVMQRECPLCEGNGRVLSEEYIIRKLERKLERIFKENDVESVIVEVNDAIEYYLRQNGSDYIKYMEQTFNKKIAVKGLANIGYSDINIKAMGSAGMIEELLSPFKVGDKVEVNSTKSKYLNAQNRYNLFNGKIEEIIYDNEKEPQKIVVRLE